MKDERGEDHTAELAGELRGRRLLPQTRPEQRTSIRQLLPSPSTYQNEYGNGPLCGSRLYQAAHSPEQDQTNATRDGVAASDQARACYF